MMMRRLAAAPAGRAARRGFRAHPVGRAAAHHRRHDDVCAWQRLERRGRLLRRRRDPHDLQRPRPEADGHGPLAEGLHRGICPCRDRHPGRGRSPSWHGIHRGSRGGARGQDGAPGLRVFPVRSAAGYRRQAALGGLRSRHASVIGNPADCGTRPPRPPSRSCSGDPRRLDGPGPDPCKPPRSAGSRRES